MSKKLNEEYEKKMNELGISFQGVIMQKVDEIIKCNETDKMTKDEFEEYKVKSYNESIGDLKEEDGIDCPICKNKGFIKYIQKQNNRN